MGRQRVADASESSGNYLPVVAGGRRAGPWRDAVL